MRLKNIREVVRFANKKTGQVVNVKKGVGTLGYDIYFYTYRGSRVLIPASDVSHEWVRFSDIPVDVIVNGSIVKLSKKVKNHHCPEGRDDFVVAKVLNAYGDGIATVVLSGDLHGCKYWHKDDLVIVK